MSRRAFRKPRKTRGFLHDASNTLDLDVHSAIPTAGQGARHCYGATLCMQCVSAGVLDKRTHQVIRVTTYVCWSRQLTCKSKTLPMKRKLAEVTCTGGRKTKGNVLQDAKPSIFHNGFSRCRPRSQLACKAESQESFKKPYILHGLSHTREDDKST